MKKQGVSQMIEYVMVIVVVLALALLLYFYLSNYVPVEAPACPDGVKLVVESISCTDEHYIEYTLVNEGLFTIDGIHVSAGSAYRLFRDVLNEEDMTIYGDAIAGGGLAPNERVTFSYEYPDPERTNEVMFQPVMYVEDNVPSLCSAAVAKSRVYCNVCFNGEVNDGEAYDNDTLLGIIEVYPQGVGGSSPLTGARYTNETLKATVSFAATYETYGIVGRGDPTSTPAPDCGGNQTWEHFHLEINGIHGPISYDPNNFNETHGPCFTLLPEFLGIFSIDAGPANITVWSNGPPISPPTTTGGPHSVDIDSLCVYEIPVE